MAVKFRGDVVTATATPTDGNASVAFLDGADDPLTDADPAMAGFQVDVPVGEWTFKVAVTAEDGQTTQVYAVVVERDSPDLYGWSPSRDFNTLQAAGNGSPQGIWSDGTTMWVADDDDDKLYAYALSDGTRQDGTGGTTNREIALATDNGSPRGIWSNGTTIWVADDEDDKLYAYTLSDGTRQDGTGGTTNREIALATDNGNPKGIWSDATTMWVADAIDVHSPIKIFAYTLSNRMRDIGKEFTPNWVPSGIWSDGTIMWVVSMIGDQGHRLAGYRLDLNADGTAGPAHGRLEARFRAPRRDPRLTPPRLASGRTAREPCGWWTPTAPIFRLTTIRHLPPAAPP